MERVFVASIDAWPIVRVFEEMCGPRIDFAPSGIAMVGGMREIQIADGQSESGAGPESLFTARLFQNE
jgi:hypothetical protein